MGGGTAARYYLILNPGSRGGRSGALFREIAAQLARYGLDCRYGITKTLADAETLSRRANRAGFDVIVAVGGDGTINRVINGFYGRNGERISRAKLGVIYTGTSPDFCLSHGLPVRDVPRAVRALAGMRSKPAGVGRIDFAHETRYFACCMNVGFGAALATAANSGIRARLGDKAGTFASLLRELARYRRYDLTVNGRFLPGVVNLSVGKTPYVASGLKIRNELRPGDERLYTLCIRDHIAWHVARLYSGGELPLAYETRVRIEGDAAVEFDGDAYGTLPCTISSAPPIEVLYEGT